MVNRGRNKNGGNKGEEIGTAKLTEQQVREIKIRLRDGEVAPKIAKDYSVSRYAIYKIKWNHYWKHVQI